MGKLTYEDYCFIPMDGKIHEIINGEHYNHPSPDTKHQRVSLNIDFMFGSYIIKYKLGHWFSAPFDVLLDKHDIVQPDKIFITKENERILTTKNVKGSPDLLIEITSEDKKFDTKIKFKRYERFRVKQYWIVDTDDEVIYVYKIKKKRYKLIGEYRKGDIFKNELFPRLKINVSEIFGVY